MVHVTRWNTALSCNTCGFFSFWTGAIWHAVLTVVGLFQFNLNLIRGKEPQFIIRIWIILIFTCHIWRTMIWGLFKKTVSLDSDQKHWSAAENNVSSLVSGFYSARSRGTRDECVSFFHKSRFLSAYCSLWCGRSVSWVLRFLLVEYLTPLKWERRPRTRTDQHTLAERERNLQGHLPFLQRHNSVSRVFQISWCCPRGSNSSFPACRWTPSLIFLLLFKDYLFHNLSQKIFFLLRIISRHTARIGVCPHLPNRPPQHGGSCVTPTDLMFPAKFLCVFCLQEVWIRGILVVLVHEWWPLTTGSFRDQRLTT